MDNFELDPRLANDCLVLGALSISQVLLMNNALVPWFILVPQRSETEITDLPLADQISLLEEINLLSKFVKDHFDISKLNIAAIGNMVSQLHIHVVGRDPADYCWPDVVWGRPEREPYNAEQIDNITAKIRNELDDNLISI